MEEIFSAIDLLQQQQNPAEAASLRFASALAYILSNSLAETGDPTLV